MVLKIEVAMVLLLHGMLVPILLIFYYGIFIVTHGTFTFTLAGWPLKLSLEAVSELLLLLFPNLLLLLPLLLLLLSFFDFFMRLLQLLLNKVAPLLLKVREILCLPWLIRVSRAFG